MILLAVFGQPVAQSLSPRIHGLFASQCGLQIEYSAIEATPGTFAQQVRDLAGRGARGCNVTVPFKNEAWRLAGSCSDNANRAEAANTLVFAAGDWFADNTDGGGLVGDLEGGCGFGIGQKRVCLLGAGGAAGGVLAELLKHGPEHLTIANRTVEKAVELAGRHSDLGSVSGCSLQTMEDSGPFDLVINATSQGHDGTAPEIPARLIREGGLCYDMNYGSASLALKKQCHLRGIRYSDGLGMLVGQAALSFRIWTGKTPETTPVLEHLRAAAGK